MRDAPGAPRAAFLDFVHADDVTAMIAAREPKLLKRFSAQNYPNVRNAAGIKHLRLSAPTTHNILLAPDLFPRGICRRSPPRTAMSTKTRLLLQRENEARWYIAPKTLILRGTHPESSLSP